MDLPPLPAPPQRAHRQRVFLNPGYLFSMTPAVASREYASAGRTTYTDVATGHGVELSVSIWQPRSFVCFGTFAQWQRYLSFNGDHNRYAFGLQAAWAIFGLEAGMARREGDELRQGTTMLHFGPVMSLAFFHIAGRFGIPISGDNGGRPHHKSEASMVLAVKIPLPLL